MLFGSNIVADHILLAMKTNGIHLLLKRFTKIWVTTYINVDQIYKCAHQMETKKNQIPKIAVKYISLLVALLRTLSERDHLKITSPGILVVAGDLGKFTQNAPGYGKFLSIESERLILSARHNMILDQGIAFNIKVKENIWCLLHYAVNLVL